MYRTQRAIPTSLHIEILHREIYFKEILQRTTQRNYAKRGRPVLYLSPSLRRRPAAGDVDREMPMWTVAGGDRGPAGDGAPDPQEKGRRRVAGATAGRQRMAAKEGTDGG
jgi:hypothetical protein